MEVDEQKPLVENGEVPAPSRIHFGSLEHVEREKAIKKEKLRMVTGNEEEQGLVFGSDDISIARESSSSMEVLPISNVHLSAHSSHQKLIEDMEIRKRANEIAVPTSDELVKARLIELEEPIILFAETKPMRRQRLRIILATRGITQGMPAEALAVGSVPMEETPLELRPFSTEGTKELLETRLFFLKDSIIRSQNRLAAINERDTKFALESDDAWNQRLAKEATNLYQPLSSLLPSISVVGDPRPLTSISFNSDGSMLATSSWNTVCKIWNAETGTEIQTLRGHTERVIDISFVPNSSSCFNEQNNIVQLASAGTDKTIKLWNANSNAPLASLNGHEDRVNILAWHPAGKHLFASSHDCTWSLWDITTQKLLLKQDGHSRAVFGLSLHPDGGLLATGSVDASVRIWDVRSGKSVHTFQGHVRQVLGADWHPEGVLLATCSEDHGVRVWDMRMRKHHYTIAAHPALISDVKFAPHHGNYLVTSGYDNVARVWKTDDWSMLCTLSGHDSRVTALDISPVANHNHNDDTEFPPVCIATAGYDRTWKLWKPLL